MRFIVFSDIHGNSYAWDAFLEKIKGIDYDYLIFCGDIFGYYYNQKEIIHQLAEMKQLIWVKGNHDDYALRLYNGDIREDEYVEQYGHSYANVKARFEWDQMSLLASLPSEYILNEEHCRIGIFHGTPENSLEGRLYPDQPVKNTDDYRKYDYVILGHTHCRMMRQEGHTLVINSGSLGQPRDGNGYGFAVLDTNLKQVNFYTIEINQKLLYQQIDQFDPKLKKLKEVLERKRK